MQLTATAAQSALHRLMRALLNAKSHLLTLHAVYTNHNTRRSSSAAAMQQQQNRIETTATTTIYSILDHSTPIYALMQAWPGLETEYYVYMPAYIRTKVLTAESTHCTAAAATWLVGWIYIAFGLAATSVIQTYRKT